MIRIKIEEKNIADIWSLACVRWIEKMGEGRVVVGISYKKEYQAFNSIRKTVPFSESEDFT